jgi:hypothetical protein
MEPRDPLLAAKVRVPDRVVYRAFPEETVMLNLTTGKYHGLNPTATRMLATLERSGTVAEALAELIGTYNAPAEEVERDLRGLCDALLERQLIVLVEP